MKKSVFVAALVSIALGAIVAPRTALAGDGELFVANEQGGTIGAYDATTGGAISPSLVTGLQNPHAVWVAGGSVFVSSFNAIGEYDAGTGAPVDAPLITGATRLAGGVIVSGSDLYLTTGSQETGVGGVKQYTTSGAVVNTSLVTGLNNPYGIALSGNTLYVAIEGQNYQTGTGGTIAEFNATTGALINANFVTGLSQPEGIWVSGNNLYVANNADTNEVVGPLTNGTIGEYDATTGAVINASLVSGLNQPVGVAVLGNNLYVSTFSNNVGLYDATTGATINANFITGLNDPQGLFVIATPEPSALVLLALGSLKLFALSRRKFRS